MSELKQQLEAARQVVRGLTFGTPQWEAAMVTVRALVDQVNASRPPFVHTSIDGDIFAP